ncbi:LLM class flavin-dependent oxidoreductase [Alicyclobacillus cycloheptanicus]|uniref:Luciferase family oxidoreductase group 1 n=1 Tax=Alicyclobacillus cycloheptanicus TaxID=1457 RepID=A0ABT9XIX9_9BACL|nr:LLM class flavin-dependent oxidoreductase [Alicyclobacillus cycloheptanicus]MDQ0189738.1 luciferase family oxidoreductase group 1 [Alicyclobacillus cycloheptanicus]WDM01948.1 LLM class flavin-dependent oxidoreductase [Alicyclobacillus cycloheptanicus]
MQLSILDQSPISIGGTARQAIQETVRLAQAAEQLGFHRFWVSEHHDAPSLAGSTPEVLLSHLGAKTNRIRIGSGGVMLPHYSAYKVAENFRMLEALYPNRVDLGLGRAPGGMPRSTMALQEGKSREVDYGQQVSDLKSYLTDTLPEDHRFPGLRATPIVDTVPELWLLGSSDWSAHMAAYQGTAFMFAQFINGDGGVEAVEAYLERFQPSPLFAKPKASVAIFTVCADTEAQAELIASTLDLSLVMLANGQRSEGTPTIEMAQNYSYSRFELALIKENRRRMIMGDKTSVKQQIEELAKRYHTDEVMLTIRAPEFADRVHSFELIAEAFGLVRNG